jgi:aspartyl protease family protein
MAQGSINGASTRFLIDTGATMVVMSANEAERLGIDYKRGPQGTANTANGPVAFRLVKLDRVKIGDVELSQVEAGVMTGAYDGPVLLGMSFLSRTEVTRDGQSMVLTKRF